MTPGLLRLAFLSLLLVAAWAAPSTTAAQVRADATYDSAGVDSSRAVVIRTHDHRRIVVPPDSDQVGVDQLAISPDRHAVGWLVLYPNCCTAYPIPLVLKVYSQGAVHAFRGVELPVWRWTFEAGGAQVAFLQETVHGGFGTHYELRDILSGRLLGQYEPRDSTAPPSWAVRLREASPPP